jgi:ribonucleoside-diphosphate reductase beta chain
MSNLMTPSVGYKPFRYEWAFEAYQQQQRIHWLPEEVPMADDVKDWQKNLTPAEKNLLTQILRFFTQGDIEVASNYMLHYMPVFRPVEICMMLAAFTASEANHVHSYSHLIDTLGMPETEYTAFLQYAEMRAKADFFKSFNANDTREIAKTLAAFGAFTEGLALFSSFSILISFQRFGKMKGVGQIIAWSVRDETLHCLSMIRLFHTLCEENPGLLDDSLRQEIIEICRTTVEHEDAFIDLAFEMGPVQGLTAEEIKAYVRYIADRRLLQLGFAPIYGVKKNPLPWLDELLNNVAHESFFETRATEYSRAATRGNWNDAF